MLVESAQSRDLLMLQNAMTVVGEFAAHAMGRSSLVERGIISVLGQLVCLTSRFAHLLLTIVRVIPF